MKVQVKKNKGVRPSQKEVNLPQGQSQCCGGKLYLFAKGQGAAGNPNICLLIYMMQIFLSRPILSYQYDNIECEIVKRCSKSVFMSHYKPSTAEHWTEPNRRQLVNIKLGSDQMSNNLSISEVVIPHRVLLDEVGACSFLGWSFHIPSEEHYLENITTLLI